MDTNSRKKRPSLLQGCALVIGGALLVFFDCVGFVVDYSIMLALVMLAVGVIVFIWGTVTTVRALTSSGADGHTTLGGPRSGKPPDPPQ